MQQQRLSTTDAATRDSRDAGTVTVVEAIAQELRAAGVRRIYGMPGGGSNMALIEAAAAHGLEFVLVHHEPAAIFMAAGEAEVTGCPGVCLATLGPGVANSINGLAHCSLDRVPLLLITDTPDDRSYSHQRIDHGALVAAAVKRSHTIDPASVRTSIRDAVARSLEAPAGAVHLDLSPRVGAADSGPIEAVPVSAEGAHDPSPADVASAAQLLAQAARPVLIAGLAGRSATSARALRDFAERFGLPLLTTYKAKGVLPEDHPLAAGLVTNGLLEDRVLGDADALIGVGFDPVELMQRPWRWSLPMVSLTEYPHDPQPVATTIEVRGDLAQSLRALEESLVEQGWTPAWGPDRGPWAWAQPEEIAGDEASTLGVAPADVVRGARRLAPPGTVATVDAGSHMFAATLFWSAESPRRFLISNGLSTMGYALPAAIGASLACPDDPVVCFTGDGGLAMVVGELETAARLSARVVIVVFNDRTLNLIKIKQAKLGRETEELDFGAIDWATVARGMGVEATQVSDAAAFDRAFADAIASPGPTLIDVDLDPSTYPALLAVIRG
jgi:acetolactate synthase-1/2/3 large subunit